MSCVLVFAHGDFELEVKMLTVINDLNMITLIVFCTAY